ncbi:carbohydrate ABC transporter permease [uncultured Amnibacterium sp.]|uniref:carbohydrate ABC transporter permease n=1 Tax=uncultured Amnibacterium sp. TaxID=1631851 RepID=UPI0035CC1896
MTSSDTKVGGERPPTGFRRALAGVGVAGASAPQGAGGTGSTIRRRGAPAASRLTLLVLVVPSVLLLVLVNGYPLLYGFFQSVQDGSLITAGNFVGLANYIDVVTQPRFWSAALFTVVFTLVGVFGSWLIGLALALLLRVKAPGSATFKVLLMLPWVVPIVVSATAWNWLVATSESPIPTIARALGLGSPTFLADPTLAAILVCIFKVWVSFPFMMLMTSAALAAVDPSVYEASGMDGATRWQQLTQITLPMIARSTYISWILMTIFSVNDFPTIFLLTGGGPVNATTSLIVLAYRTVFQDFQTGPGVAIAFLMTVVLVLISVFLFRQIQKVETE